VFVRHLLSHGASWRSIYLQGIDTEEIVATVHARRVLDVADALGDELH
jgi:hypothetical protein